MGWELLEAHLGEHAKERVSLITPLISNPLMIASKPGKSPSVHFVDPSPFPLAKVVVVLCVLTGAVPSWVMAAFTTSE